MTGMESLDEAYPAAKEAETQASIIEEEIKAVSFQILNSISKSKIQF